MAEGDPIRIIVHDESFEVRFAYGQASKYFYFSDEPIRREMMMRLTREEAKEAARNFARAQTKGN